MSLVRFVCRALAAGLLTAGGPAWSAVAEPQPARIAIDCLPAGVPATFVLLDPQSGRLQIAGGDRADQRFLPASTFKIPNTLIGLETGAVANVDQVLPYGGKPQWRPEWQHDMALREAIKLSAVPIYQELARRIGLERMATMVARLGYGNAEIGSEVDRFWLQGPLKISAVEQVQFLNRMLSGELLIRAANVAAVEDITLQEQTADHAQLHYKTGWATASTPQVGWVVGWVRRGEVRRPFAFNMMVRDDGDLPRRLELAKACLVALAELKTG